MPPRARNGGARNPRRAEIVDAGRRQNLALRVYLGGQRSYQAIADTPDPGRPGQTLYGDRGAAHKAIARAVARLRKDRETLDALAVSLAELDVLQRSLWPVALADRPDRYEALNQLKWIFDHWARLRGDYAPTRSVAEFVSRDMVDAEIERLTREIAAEDAAAAGLLDEAPAPLPAAEEDA